MITRCVAGVRPRRTGPIVNSIWLLRALLLAAAASLPLACGSSASTNITGPTATKCQVTLSSGASELPATGGHGTLNVSAERECSWTASTSAAWVALASTSGQGPATIDYSVQPNPNGAPRSAQIAVSNQSVDIVQAAAPCKYAVNPETATVDAAGSALAFSLTATPGCQWAARSSADWIGSASPATGTGSATVRFAVSANPAAAVRVASITVGEAQATVQQAGVAAPVPQPPTPAPTPEPPPPGPPPPIPPSCTFTVAPLSASVPASGGNVSVIVTAPTGCAWTTTSSADWITITAGATGSGAGSVVATVAANTGAARTGTIIAAGRTVTINQAAQPAPSCTYQLTPPSLDVTSDAQDSTIAVTAPDGCQWTPTPGVPWLTVDVQGAISGSGTFKLSVAANTGDARVGTVQVGTSTLTVQQAAGVACGYTIAPTSYTAGLAADAVDVNVTAGATCAWTAATDVTWVAIASGSSGTGNGVVHLTIDANAGAARSAIVTIAGQPFTVQQSGVCTYAIKPTYYDAGKGPDTITVSVIADAGCSWTASSPVTWATIADGATGTGNGTVKIAVQANDGSQRAATLTIAGQPFQLTQKGTH